MGALMAAVPVTDVATFTFSGTAGLVLPPDAAVIWVVPAATPVARPLVPMVATAFTLLAQVKDRPVMTLPFLSLAVAVNCCVAFTAIDGEVGVTVMLATVARAFGLADGAPP
jgi:hypothetical protein